MTVSTARVALGLTAIGISLALAVLARPTDGGEERPRRIVTTVDAPQALGPYARSNRPGDILFLGRPPGLDPSSRASLRRTIEGRARRGFEGLARILGTSRPRLDHGSRR
jgi:hypothetical protein